MKTNFEKSILPFANKNSETIFKINQIVFFSNCDAKNKNIELISISIDKDKAKWEKKLAEDKPKWKQYICLDNYDSQLCKNYDITGIPRFLFFDKGGKVISLNAPRPSSEDIIEYIDKYLAE